MINVEYDVEANLVVYMGKPLKTHFAKQDVPSTTKPVFVRLLGKHMLEEERGTWMGGGVWCSILSNGYVGRKIELD